jgi:hypothetical protein
MTLVVREGVYEMLEFLKPFCNFYAYSHGLKDYIEKILEKIDPLNRFFEHRSERIRAPIDGDEQRQFIMTGKGFKDFRQVRDTSQCVFSEAELKRCVIVDDQYAVVRTEFRGKV